jgi:hypothetical protein
LTNPESVDSNDLTLFQLHHNVRALSDEVVAKAEQNRLATRTTLTDVFEPIASGDELVNDWGLSDVHYESPAPPIKDLFPWFCCEATRPEPRKVGWEGLA